MCGDVGAASQGRAGHGGQIERSPEVMEARCYPLLWLEGGVAGEPCAGQAGQWGPWILLRVWRPRGRDKVTEAAGAIMWRPQSRRREPWRPSACIFGGLVWP